MSAAAGDQVQQFRRGKRDAERRRDGRTLHRLRNATGFPVEQPMDSTVVHEESLIVLQANVNGIRTRLPELQSEARTACATVVIAGETKLDTVADVLLILPVTSC